MYTIFLTDGRNYSQEIKSYWMTFQGQWPLLDSQTNTSQTILIQTNTIFLAIQLWGRKLQFNINVHITVSDS